MSARAPISLSRPLSSTGPLRRSGSASVGGRRSARLASQLSGAFELPAVCADSHRPETQILDAAIQRLQKRYINQILAIGAVCTVVMAAIFLPLPMLR